MKTNVSWSKVGIFTGQVILFVTGIVLLAGIACLSTRRLTPENYSSALLIAGVTTLVVSILTGIAMLGDQADFEVEKGRHQTFFEGASFLLVLVVVSVVLVGLSLLINGL